MNFLERGGDTTVFSSASYDSRRRGRHGGLLTRSDALRVRGDFENLVGVVGKIPSNEDARKLSEKWLPLAVASHLSDSLSASAVWKDFFEYGHNDLDRGLSATI